MDNQSSTGGSIVAVKKNGEDLVDEQIDERILRLLGLEYIFDIDYDTYTSLLKEKMVAARMAKTQIPTEEAELLTNEYKKIRGKKGRFKVKKITADSFKKGSAVGINLGKQKALIGKPQLALPPADKMTGGNDIKEIIDALAEIIKSLTSQNKLAKDSAEKSRIAGEAAQRGEKESRLEKGFKFAIKAAEKIIAPIKSLLDRIIDFFVAIFVGRALIKLLDWFSDSKNQDKIKAIGRFLGDQWPKLLALYIMFGTGLGKFVGFLTKIVIRGGIKLAAAAAGLLAKAGVGKAAGAAKFLGGKYGKLLGAGLELTATVGTTMAVSKGIENFGGIGGEEQKTQGYSGGGFVIPKFAGGGLNFKGMMGGAGMGSMFGPLGMLLGAGLGSGKIQETVSGLIGGQKGVDKVPAMLTDGEFVMSRGAVQKYGVDTLESMNAAGGGTNQPKIVSGTTYAAGGGMIGGKPMNKSSSSPIEPKIPTLSPINLSSSSSSNVNVGSGNNAIDISANLIKKEEALSSLSPGKNDYIVPGGKSVVSGTDWSNISPKTKIYAYPDSKGIPTIGWGATFYDGITSGTKSVKLGDSITKENADKTLANNIGILAKKYSKEIANWSKMSPQQQSAILSIGYNAGPNAPLGAYPKLSAAIKSGNMVEVANNITRDGPSAERIANEKKLLLSGPKDLTKQTTAPSKITTPIAKNQPNMFQKFGSAISSIMSPSALAEQPSASSKLNPAQIQTQNNVPKINPPSKSKVKVVYATSPGGMPKLNTSSGASPSVPSFSAVHPNSESRRRNAAVLGVK